jgi:hypothetical protein
MPRVSIELIPDPDVGGFTARVPGLPAYGEGATEGDAIEDLKEAVRGCIESFGLAHALARISPPVEGRQPDLDLDKLARG